MWGGKEQPLVGRCLWEWMDAVDKATVIAAIAIGTSCSDDTQHRVRCTLRSPVSAYQQQQQGMHVRVMLTFRLSERGLVFFIRPVGREEYGIGSKRETERERSEEPNQHPPSTCKHSGVIYFKKDNSGAKKMV